MSTGALDRRVETRPLPLDRVVKWLPRDDAFYLLAAVLTSASAEPLVVAREALLQVERHLRAPGCASGCGVLLGATYVCPRTRIRYLLVEGAVGAVTSITEQESPATTIARLRALVTEAPRRSKRQVVGWYRGGAAIVPHVAPRDVAVHRELFPDAWHVALLRDGVGPGHSGAFVRVEPVEERAYFTPFHELLPRKRWRGGEARHTAVAWANHRTEAAVVPLAEVAAERRGSDNDSVAPAQSVPSPNSVQPPDRAPPPTQAPVRSGEPALESAAAPAPASALAQASTHAPTQAAGSVDPPVAPAPSEPLAFVWMPPRASESASVVRGPWRIALWAAAVAVAITLLLTLWRLTG